MLVTYHSAALPPLAIAAQLTDDEARLAGLMPGVDAPEPVGWFDPLPLDERDDDEDERGVPILRHPELLLADDPELWVVVDEWRAGVARELARGELDTLSDFYVEAWLTMRAAHGREDKREVERLREKQAAEGHA